VQGNVNSFANFGIGRFFEAFDISDHIKKVIYQTPFISVDSGSRNDSADN
jgi:hypothetical protein